MKKIFYVFIIASHFSMAQSPIDYNLSFENINTNGVPTNWSSEGEWLLSDDAYEGMKALKIWTWYVYSPTIFKLRQPYNSPASKGKIRSLRGFHKYIFGMNNGKKDSAEVSIVLTKYNLGVLDTIGMGIKRLGPSDSYKEFVVNINYTKNLLPDSLEVKIKSHFFDERYDQLGIPLVGWCENTQECLFLTIDALKFEYTTPTNEAANLKLPIKIYPNPTHNTLQLSWGENNVNQLIIKDTMGRILHKMAANTEGVTLDTSTWAAGIYFIEFTHNSKEILTVQKVVKQ